MSDSFEQLSLFAKTPVFEKERPAGVPVSSNSPLEAPYAPPARACYVCKQVAWVWNGEGYHCAGDAQAHQEYEAFLAKLHRQLWGRE